MLKEKHFLLNKGLINLNHGSFGTVPKKVLESHFNFLTEQESCPEVWFRETYFKYINESRKLVANLIKTKTENVVLVENASYAVNSVLRSFPFKVYSQNFIGIVP
jgi:isopenicillin-N epimerase